MGSYDDGGNMTAKPCSDSGQGTGLGEEERAKGLFCVPWRDVPGWSVAYRFFAVWR